MRRASIRATISAVLALTIERPTLGCNSTNRASALGSRYCAIVVVAPSRSGPSCSPFSEPMARSVSSLSRATSLANVCSCLPAAVSDVPVLFEQTHTQLFFQSPDVRSDGRLTEMQDLRGLRGAQPLRNRTKYNQPEAFYGGSGLLSGSYNYHEPMGEPRLVEVRRSVGRVAALLPVHPR